VGVASDKGEAVSGTTGAGSETVGGASGMAVAVSGSSVLSVGVSIGCAKVADFGCHFLRSGAGALVSGVDAGAETGTD
jgi:hypothetical protein